MRRAAKRLGKSRAEITRSALEDFLERYEDLRLGFADACVIACAERNGGRVLTFDERGFVPVAREGKISLVPSRG
jgi:predicted nucleic acid-binding protein